MSDVTGPHSLTGPERAIDSAYIHVTVPDGTVDGPSGSGPDVLPADGLAPGGVDPSAGPRHATTGNGLGAGEAVPPAGFAVHDGAGFAAQDGVGLAASDGAGFAVGPGLAAGPAFAVERGFTVGDGFAVEHGLGSRAAYAGPDGLEPEGTAAPAGYDTGGPPAAADPTPPSFADYFGALVPTRPQPLASAPATPPPGTEPPSPPGPYIPAVLQSSTGPQDQLDQQTPPGGWEDQRFPGIGRGDMLELAGRLEQLDQLLDRLEEAKRQAADASEHLVLTRRWQEETVRTIQEERARMRQRQHALDELAERARAAVEAMQAMHRTVPREVLELAIELQVLDRAGFITRRAPRQQPGELP
ncbi:hypothetical protein [Pseudofrankia inefficax]|uniref:Uncharacterized protein n=1 Tax=Pseudofrankia inefficax (strain DSM 45817 / CECT 9037 / DDB 130130 / EuI1c) TaxID=298654 RepID=E3JDN5_PSEI1|nr:hypothetical protein FraEuI1c_6832 [Pseudofrankia inefficax]